MSIATNLKAVDMVKSEILSEVALLYRTLADYEDEEEYDNVAEQIASIIAMDYILARRLGISYSVVDDRIRELLDMAVEGSHPIEVEFMDMSELRRYLKNR